MAKPPEILKRSTVLPNDQSRLLQLMQLHFWGKCYGAKWYNGHCGGLIFQFNHSFIFCKPIPAVMGREKEYALDRSPEIF